MRLRKGNGPRKGGDCSAFNPPIRDGTEDRDIEVLDGFASGERRDEWRLTNFSRCHLLS